MNGFRVVVLSVLVLNLYACTNLQTDDQKYVNKNTVSSEAALEAYTRLGLQYLRGGDTSSAKSSVQRALEIREDYAPAYNALGLIFQVEDEKGLAEQYYRKAISLDEKSAMFHNNYGAFLFSQQRYEEACKQLAIATEDPFYNSRGQAFENLGRCLNRIGKTAEAISAFERSLKTGGRRPQALVELAQLYLDANQIANAEGYYKEFSGLVDDKRVSHSAKSLWVGILIARMNNDVSTAATYALLLKNLYPASEEYKSYKESAQ
ncbi:type IV pilus biogenesis/stability protein PilW [Neptunomonas phycophila]|uniref:type IV pilus biogenesis/stability protein PilW n=1 Tax=Neptunomonas phycophila TaxID=1572645 RepID=UPI000948E593|nr:type IV pilus biogenesis/stability protein PilW [Neptunomonas phycophila]